MENEKLKSILEAALLAAGGSLSLDRMQDLFEEDSAPEKKELREVLESLSQDYDGRGMQLTETGSGWRIQVRAEYAEWVSRLWEEKPARYSRALLETLALIAYRQPITRGEIEDVRGVSVSSNIIKTLHERDWIRVVGHRDVPGRPALYATSKVFLDYFNLKSLNDLPSLAEIRDLDSINQELELADPDKQVSDEASNEATAEQDLHPDGQDEAVDIAAVEVADDDQPEAVAQEDDISEASDSSSEDNAVEGHQPEDTQVEDIPVEDSPIENKQAQDSGEPRDSAEEAETDTEDKAQESIG
jgi:segregation and condensation protein B